MLQTSLTVFLAILIVVALVAIFSLWKGKGWFLQWLKGSIGFILLAGIVLLALALVDLWSYQQINQEKPIATVSVFELGEQDFDLTIATSDGKEQRYQILGDQWQLDARLLTWKGPFAQAGALPLYRLDRLSGRYLSLEQERTAQRSVYSLASSQWLDLWNWMHKYSVGFDANYGSAVFMPLTNGAVYSVRLTSKGLIARPLNDVAEEVLGGSW